MPRSFAQVHRTSNHDERGSTVPLILGFFLMALLMVLGAVAAADAYLDQRSLQGICDGAALAGANVLDEAAVYGPQPADLGSTDALPLGDAQLAIDQFLSRDAQRRGVTIESAQITDGSTVVLTCAQTLPVTFGTVFGFADGVHHRATAAARSRLV